MIRTFFMKYRFPLRYAAIKVLANHVHEAMVPRSIRIPVSRVPEPLRFSTHGSSNMADWTTNRRAKGKAERDYCVHQIALTLPRVPVTKRQRPYTGAATKRNGGLKGSAASKWR